MKRIVYIIFEVLLIAFTATICVAQNESVTVVTYYPSPYGVYRQLRLHPTNDITSSDCNVNNQGSMYYDATKKEPMVCSCSNPPACSTFQWKGLGVPTGTIVMWSGTLALIPSGWQLCNGTNGTPNLQDRFIYGVHGGEDPGLSGGSLNTSGAIGGQVANAMFAAAYFLVSGSGHYHTSSLPPYYKLAFIMKL